MQRREADADVDGVPTVFATLTDRPAPGSSTVTNRLAEARKRNGLARAIVMDGEEAGLSAAAAERGLARYLQLGHGDYDNITIFTTDGWVTWP